jgi:hypothetical protein
MKHCPICRASLNGAGTCRRCRADLAKVQEVEIQGRQLAGAALHSLALGETEEALRLLRLSCWCYCANCVLAAEPKSTAELRR